MVTAGDEEAGPSSLERLVFFSDAVFAIAITLLVLPLTDSSITNEGIGRQLLDLAPKVFSFVLTFLIIGLLWIGASSQLCADPSRRPNANGSELAGPDGSRVLAVPDRRARGTRQHARGGRALRLVDERSRAASGHTLALRVAWRSADPAECRREHDPLYDLAFLDRADLLPAQYPDRLCR
jgi:transmembrane protein TMEM174 (potassium channel)